MNKLITYIHSEVISKPTVDRINLIIGGAGRGNSLRAICLKDEILSLLPELEVNLFTTSQSLPTNHINLHKINYLGDDKISYIKTLLSVPKHIKSLQENALLIDKHTSSNTINIIDSEYSSFFTKSRPYKTISINNAKYVTKNFFKVFKVNFVSSLIFEYLDALANKIITDIVFTPVFIEDESFKNVYIPKTRSLEMTTEKIVTIIPTSSRFKKTWSEINKTIIENNDIKFQAIGLQGILGNFPNLKHYPSDYDLKNIKTNLIISNAGLGTILEAKNSNIKIITIALSNHIEQSLNSYLVEKHKLGKSATLKTLPNIIKTIFK